MAKRQAEPEVASLNPKDMLAGGLKDDFRGRVTDATYSRWDYDGNIDEPVLAGKLTIDELDPDTGESLGEDPIVQHWSAGDLSAFVPSQDGKNPAEEDEDGPYALKVGKRAGLNNNTNWAHLINSAIESGTAAKGKPFTDKDLTASAECLIGLDAHWNRVPQKKRSGLVDAEGEGEKKRGRDVLVITDVYGYGEAASGKKAKSKPNGQAGKPTSAKSRKDEDEDDDDQTEESSEKSPLDEKLEEVVAAAITEAGGKLKKGKLPTIILKELAKDKDKSKGVRRVSEEDFLENGPWTYDEDSGVLSMKAKAKKGRDEDEDEEEAEEDEDDE